MKNIFNILSILLYSLYSYSQLPTAPNETYEKEKRQGDWVIYYDSDWEEIEDASNAEFYRKISYKNDKPIGLVTDFYSNGIKQWEGELSSDRPDFAHGNVKYYYDNGKIRNKGLVENNIPVGKWKYFTYLGKYSHHSIYINGIEQGFVFKLNSGYDLINQGELDSANIYFKEGVLMLKELSNYHENNIVADNLFYLARNYVQNMNHKRSLELINDCLTIRESVYGKYHPDYAKCLNFKALCHFKLSEYDISLKYYMSCLKIKEKIYDKRHPEIYVALNNIALNYSEMGSYEKSLEMFEEALNIVKFNYGEKGTNYALALGNISVNYLKMGNYKKALELNKECLDIYEKEYGKSDKQYLLSLSNLGMLYTHLGEFHKSLDVSKECLDIREKLYGKDHMEYATGLNNLAITYMWLGKYDTSLQLINKCLNIRENNLGKIHSLYLESLMVISQVHMYLFDYEKALITYKESLIISEKIYGKDHPVYASLYNNLAHVYSERGSFSKAIDLFSKGISMIEKSYGKEHPEYSRNLNNFGLAYYSSGNYIKSMSIFNKVAELQNIQSSQQSQLMNLNNLALNFSALGDYDKELEILLEIEEKSKLIYGENHIDHITILNNIGTHHLKIGALSKALEYFNKAIELTELNYGKFHKQYLLSLSNLGLLYNYLGDYSKALELNQHAIEIAQNIYDDLHPSLITLLNNKAIIYSFNRQYQEAEDLYNKVINSLENNHLEKLPMYSLALNNISWLYKTKGNYKKSLDFAIKSLKTEKNNFGKFTLNYSKFLNKTGMIHMKLNEYREANDMFMEAININETILGKENSETYFPLKNLIDNYIAVGKYDISDSFFLSANNIKQTHYFSNMGGFSEKEKENLISSLILHQESFLNYTIFRKEEKPLLASDLLTQTLLLKGSLLSSNQQIQNKVKFSKDTSLINLYENWKLGKLQLGKYYETTLQELEKNGVDLQTEEERVNALEQELSRKSLSFEESQKRYTWEDVKSKLNPNEAYVELIRTDHYDFKEGKWTDKIYYAALIIDQSTVDYPELVVFENGNELEEIGYDYYTSHTTVPGYVNRGLEVNTTTHRDTVDVKSYDHYWGAIAEKIKGKKRVYVSSDGVYNKINLNVLYNKKTKKYLGEEVDIRLITSGRDLFKTYPEEEKELTAVLVGSPKYDLIQEEKEEEDLLVSRDLQQYWIDSLSRGFSVTSLPGTAVEVKNISGILKKNKWEVKSYTEEEALEGKVKSVSSPTVLHIATHGYFFEDVAHEKASPTRMMGVDSKKATQNPLLRSGLLFAGAKNTLNGNEPKSGDNGLLTAYEASYMDLRGTELVVMSACETARGEIKNGEGVYGLQRAIQQAGAENIIMSMWKVDDKVTQEFMTMFYEKWLSGSTKREAFNSTQQQIKETYKHPYYWGPFVLIGR